LIENFIKVSEILQLNMLSWAMDNFLDKSLDQSITENARYAIARKILLLMIENSSYGALA
jgi:hypothetical protein